MRVQLVALALLLEVTHGPKHLGGKVEIRRSKRRLNLAFGQSCGDGGVCADGLACVCAANGRMLFGTGQGTTSSRRAGSCTCSYAPPSPPSPPPPSPPPTPATCSHLKATNPSAADGIYLIDPDGPGGLDAFEVYCDMTKDGGGWTMVTNRIRESIELLTPNAVTPTTTGYAIWQNRFDALKPGATHFMVQMAGSQQHCGGSGAAAMGCSLPCLVVTISNLQSANCKAYTATTQIIEWKYVHDETSGCGGSGGDYSMFMGVTSTRRTYFATLASANRMGARTCMTTARPTSTTLGAVYLEQSQAQLYMKHVVGP